MVAAEFRQVVSVFLASPGDLNAEREIARDVVARFNRRFSRLLNVTVELVIWEDVPSSHGRPQETINRDHLARCELFVGMLHERWGSATGKYSSGFEEEFTISEESLKESGRPAMGVLFKHVDEGRRNDPGKELAKVLEFKKSIGDRILHKTFNSDAELKENLEDILVEHVLGLKLRHAKRVAEDVQSNREAGPTAGAEAPSEEEGVPQLPAEGTVFLRAFVAKAQGTSEASPLTRVEIARFRLLSTLVSEGNDVGELGVHDANTLFTYRDDLDFADRECFGLIDTGLAQFKSENVPLWHWLMRVNQLDGPSLGIRSLSGPPDRRTGALRLMKLLRSPIGEADNISRSFYLKLWFHESTPNGVREAALEYLAVCGVDGDLEAVLKEVDGGGYQTQTAANHAYVRILQRRNSEDALRALVELDFDGVTQEVVARVFERPEVLVTETLVAATAHRSRYVRRAATAVLRTRKALTKDLAEQLSDDDAPAVRLEALSARVEAGEAIDDDAAKAVLVRKKKIAGGLGALGALSFGSLGELEGEEQFAQFRQEALLRLTAAELKRRVADAHIFNQTPVFDQIRRSFATRGGELREALNDQFTKWSEREFEASAARGVKEETLSRIRKFEDSLRKEWTRAALDIVTARKQAADLNLLRAVLASGYITPTKSDMIYLAAVGEWSDIQTVLAFYDHMRGGDLRSLIGSYLTDEDSAFIASCVCAIAKTRLNELLSLDLNEALRPWVVRLAAPAAIRTLKNAQIIGFFTDKNDAVRRAMVLRAIATLTKARVAALFKGYMAIESYRYYNVIVWLDMATSVERSQAIEIAKRALEEGET